MNCDAKFIGSKSIGEIIEILEEGLQSEFSKDALFKELKRKIMVMKRFNRSVIADNELLHKQQNNTPSKHNDYDEVIRKKFFNR